MILCEVLLLEYVLGVRVALGVGVRLDQVGKRMVATITEVRLEHCVVAGIACTCCALQVGRGHSLGEHACEQRCKLSLADANATVDMPLVPLWILITFHKRGIVRTRR